MCGNSGEGGGGGGGGGGGTLKGIVSGKLRERIKFCFVSVAENDETQLISFLLSLSALQTKAISF